MAVTVMWLGFTLAALGFSWMTVVVHEYGHLLFGRLVGVPRRRMRVKLAASPPQVQLRSGEQWIGPDDRRYVETFLSIRSSPAAAWIFVAGGIVVETFVVAVSCVLLILAGVDNAAAIWVATSTFLVGLQLIGDMLSTTRRGRSCGDYSGMWAIHRPATVATVAGCLTARVVVLAWAL